MHMTISAPILELSCESCAVYAYLLILMVWFLTRYYWA